MFPSIHRPGDARAGSSFSNHLELTLITPPAVEPVNLKLAKLQARISYPDADELLGGIYIPAARDKIERFLRRSLITQTWDLTLDWGPAWIELPRPPLQSVVGVYTTGLDNVETIVPATLYFVNTAQSLLSLTVGAVWPVHRARAGFRVRYIAGYGATPDTVPFAIRKEILSLVAQFDDVREQVDLPQQTQAVLEPYRVVGAIRLAPGWARDDILA